MPRWLLLQKANATQRCVLLVAAGLTAQWASAPASVMVAQAQVADRPWLEQTRSADERAMLLLSAMTQDEKLRLFEGDTTLNGNGVGANACIGHIEGNARLGLPAICMADGPAGVGNGLHKVTQFPAPITGAATWNADLMAAFGRALGREHADKGHNVVLAPTINIIRTPKWGRTAEALSEDPYLTAILGQAITLGIQTQHVIATPKHFVANNQEWLRFGDGPRYEAIDARISPRALKEIYEPPFEATVRSGAGAVMCAYNRVNGAYACEDTATLSDLRDWGFNGFVVADWYFAHRSTIPSIKAGLDISMPGGKSPFGFPDFYGQPLRDALASGALNRQDIDRMARNVLAPMVRIGLLDHPLTGGADTDTRNAEHYKLAEAIAEQGTVLLRNKEDLLPLAAGVRSIAVIGDDAGPHVQTSERYGGFVDDDQIMPESPVDGIRATFGAATSVSYTQGTRGIGALPPVPASAFLELRAAYFATPDFTGKPVLMRPETQIDNTLPGVMGLPRFWSAQWRGRLLPRKTGLYRFSLSGGGDIRLRIDGQPIATTPHQNFNLVTHGVAALKEGEVVEFALDYANAAAIDPTELRVGWQPAGDKMITQAAAAARKAQVAVVFVSDNISEGADRTDLRLPGDQDALITAVAEANPRTIVVLHTVGPVLMPWRDKVSAILAAWYPGEKAARSIAAILAGQVNPSGKLPVTFPADETSGPTDWPDRYPGIGTRVTYGEDLLVGYRWYDAKGIKPLYPFGYGLSYTRFSYSDLKITTDGAHGWKVSAVLRNVGERAGAEVAQLYLGMPVSADEPPWQLKGFHRVELAPGEGREISFDLTQRDLSIWNDKAHRWQISEGNFTANVGGSSRDKALTARFGVVH